MSITVYTKTTCPYCEVVKKFLDMKGAEYKTINIDDNPDATQEVMSMTGRTITPTTVIEKADGTKDVIVGVNFAQIAPAIA